MRATSAEPTSDPTPFGIREVGVAVTVPTLPERMEEEGMLLRRWRPGDAEALARAVAESADHLRPWMAWMALEPHNVEQRRVWLAEREREWAHGGDVMLGVFVDGQVAGGCGLHRRRGPRTLEIGYWIHPSFTRRGLATAVAGMLTDAAFSVPGIDDVEIHHDKANVASAGVPRRLGFRFAGERPDTREAPADMGIDCTWRMDRQRWTLTRRRDQERSGANSASGLTPPGTK